MEILRYPKKGGTTMKTLILSYSLTGNNDALAAGIAAELKAKHVRITERRRRKTLAIVLDVLFNRTPRLHATPEDLTEADIVIFVGPVWMGKVASPFRTCLRGMRGKSCNYAFVSISGGALGPNPKLGEELLLETGIMPAAVIDLHIADLLPAEMKPTMKTTSSYRLNASDIQRLTDEAVKELKNMRVYMLTDTNEYIL